MSIASELIRIQTAKANIKAAIEAKGVVVPSATTLDGYPSIIASMPTFDPYAGHDYVEIGGLKWATMNIGATSVTDYGQYFQWGDTTGYLSDNVGNDSYQKPFAEDDYKFSNGQGRIEGLTKYTDFDGKTVLDTCDDMARANWGGSWRIPTAEEFVALGNAVNTAWTNDYQGSGIAGITCTDKNDSSKVLFFPAAGFCANDRVFDVGSYGHYWSGSLNLSDMQYASYLYFDIDYVNWQSGDDRYLGFPVRGVVG